MNGNFEVAFEKSREISFGLGGGFDGHKNPDLLRKFSEYVDAPYYQQWDGYSPRVLEPKYLGNWIRENMNNSDRIHFNLDGWNKNNYKKYLRKRHRAFNGQPPNELTLFDGNIKGITNWEYHQIVTNLELLKKTIFYDKGGIIIPHSELYLPQ